LFNYFKTHYTESQRKGILGLIICIIFLQGIIFGFRYFQSDEAVSLDQSKEWLALEKSIDSLKIIQADKSKPKIYSFNPNFITDYKGYQLGLSVQEIDKLLAFRKTNQFVNSAEEFQKVTGVSDSLLADLSPYFKFPNWVNASKKEFQKKAPKAMDINKATAKDLMEISGIGPGISSKIIKERDDMGGFLSTEQYKYIWGISTEVQQSMLKYCLIKDVSKVKRYKINELSMKELASIPYYNYGLAKETITYRSMHNGIRNIEDLTKIKGFPVEKLNIIVLYLEF
jgi:DNA uptake protein ComE-like DNA-binding protein